jgi:hypothetical protein
MACDSSLVMVFFSDILRLKESTGVPMSERLPG